VADDLRARASYLAYRAGAGVVRVLPDAVGEPAARVAGRVASLAMPDRRRLVARNLQRVSGGSLRGTALQRAVFDTFDSYGRYWLELFRLPKDVQGPLDPGIHIDGFGHIEAGLAAGNGVILALPHVGGWDYAGAWLAQQGHPPTVVVEPVEPPELFEWFAGAREALGMTVVQLGPEAGRAVLGALRRNQIVCLLSDRDLTGDGVEVEFFGERTTLPAGPATLALRTGAPLLPAAVYFEGRGGHHGVVQAPVPAERQGRLREDVVRVTQEMARRFEQLIAVAPDQWHLLQPNWPSDRAASNGHAPGRPA
jgi:KDO2-lipid IV(A) lauroyltransferase